MLVELLVLHDMALLNLFSLASLVVEQLFSSSGIVLLLKFFNPVFSHFGLNVFAFGFTGFSVLLKDSNEVLDVFLVSLFLGAFFSG